MNTFLLLSSENSDWILGGISFASIIGIYGFIIAIALLPITLQFVLKGIALYKMSKNAGFNYPWLSFIPIAQVFVEFLLPRRKFELLFIKSNDRKMMAVITLPLSYPGLLGSLFANVVPVLGQIIAALIPFVALAMNWRKKYDLLITFYHEKEMSIILSVFCTLSPTAYAIILMTMMNKMPDYGPGNYYLSNIK